MSDIPGSRRSLKFAGCLILGSSLILAFVVGFGAYLLWDQQGRLPQALQSHDPHAKMPLFWEAWRHVERDFYGDLPAGDEMTYAAIHESLQLLDDPYTLFVEPQPRELERDHMRGSFGGIGVDLWRDTEGRMVLSPYPNSPAEQAGLLEGDVLLAVDGEPITDETTIDDVRAQLHGETDTSVTLSLARLEEDTLSPPFEISITRDVIRVPSVTWRVLDRDPSTGYIHVQGFTERTGEETAEALEDLLDKQVTRLILDLRNNFGGLLDPAVDVASQFLDEGVVMFEQRGNGQENDRPVRPDGIATELDLVVLVNGNTASAAEIVAGALQDQGRAILIGERTYGKGSVQLIYDLSDGSSLHVTSAIWLTPDRHQIEGIGLTPDVLVPQGPGTQDDQLDYGVEYLQGAH